MLKMRFRMINSVSSPFWEMTDPPKKKKKKTNNNDNNNYKKAKKTKVLCPTGVCRLKPLQLVAQAKFCTDFTRDR